MSNTNQVVAFLLGGTRLLLPAVAMTILWSCSFQTAHVTEVTVRNHSDRDMLFEITNSETLGGSLESVKSNVSAGGHTNFSLHWKDSVFNGGGVIVARIVVTQETLSKHDTVSFYARDKISDFDYLVSILQVDYSEDEFSTKIVPKMKDQLAIDSLKSHYYHYEVQYNWHYRLFVPGTSTTVDSRFFSKQLQEDIESSNASLKTLVDVSDLSDQQQILLFENGFNTDNWFR